jgi:hypothetical protein
MHIIIVVDTDYNGAEYQYNKAARKVHEAAESIKRNISNLLYSKAIAGKTAQNMSLFLREMTSVLRATFKEQILLETTLCREYLQKINEIDKSMSFNPSTKGIQEQFYWEAPETPQKDGIIIVDKASVEQCISQLKEGPVKEIEFYIGQVERINFDGSAGAVKDQNVIVREKTVASLKALQGIFNAFISTIENVVATMQDTDDFIAKGIANWGPFTPGLPLK